MDIKDILSLVNAGFSKEEIVQMTNPATPAPEPTPAPAPVPVLEVKPVEAPAPVAVAEPSATPAPQPAQAPAQEQPTMAQVMESIAKLTSAVQANAIAQSVIPQGLQTLHNQPTAEDMLAEIIRPTFKERS